MIPDQFKQIASRLLGLEQNVGRLMAQQIPYSRYGTAFPTDNLFSGRQFFRTDRNIDYSYDLANTRWLSITIVSFPLVPRETQAFTQAVHTLDARIYGAAIGNGVYLETLEWSFFPNGTAQSGTNFYTITNGVLGGSGTPTLSGTTDTKTMTINAWNDVKDTFSANQVQASTFFLYNVTMTPSGAPGTFFFNATLRGRLIG
jgi:hypothetical protein